MQGSRPLVLARGFPLQVSTSDGGGGGGMHRFEPVPGSWMAAPQEAVGLVCLAGCDLEWQEGVLPGHTQHNGAYFLNRTIK